MADLMVRDMVGIGFAAFLTGVGITFLAANRPIEPPEPLIVKEAPAACVRALNTIDHTLTATGHLMAVANRVGPLAADAYAAGLAGDDPMIDRVTELNLDLKAAYKAATKLDAEFDKQAARCRAQSEADR